MTFFTTFGTSQILWRLASLIFLSSFLFCGCSWRTKTTAYCLGPFMMRIGGGESNICETVHMPFLLQAGRQCKISVGWENQTSILEKSANTSLASDNHWQLRFWQVIPLADLPEFSRNSFFGARLQAGIDQTGIQVGYASTIEVRPQHDGIYLLSFDSRHPMATEFKFWWGVPADYADIIATSKNNHKTP
jgi:hypothetical protein